MFNHYQPLGVEYSKQDDASLFKESTDVIEKIKINTDVLVEKKTLEAMGV